MAFMMPVVKNDYNIYGPNKSGKSRRVSECTNPKVCARNRKISECSKSDGPSLSTSPGSAPVLGSPAHRSVPSSIASRHATSHSFNSHHSFGAHHSHSQSHVHFSHHLNNNHAKTSSRTSQSSLQSPSKPESSSPPKSSSTSSLSLFHNKLVDRLKRSLKSKDSVSNGSSSTLSRSEAARKRS